MIPYSELVIQSMMLLAAGLVGFGLGGMSNTENNKIRGIGWFFSGLAVGVVIAVITSAFITIN